jgi:protein SCO1/2
MRTTALRWARATWFGVLVALILSACTPYTFRGATLEPPDQAFDFTLTDQNGQPFSLAEQRGNVVLLFFGYTNCPDICPATLSDMQLVLNRLGDQANNVRMVFITVDPERDTVEKLQRFTARFDERIVGLTGDSQQLVAVYQAYGAGATRRELPNSALKYAMDHTATTTVIDKTGQRRLLFGFGSPVEDMTSDIQALLNE